MKKLFVSLFIILLIVLNALPIFAAEDTYQLQFTIINNDNNQDIDIYLLLPEEYITYAIREAGLEVEYEGAATLKEVSIPGIVVDTSKVLDETYEEKEVEYVQIKLEPDEYDIYTFEILSSYMDMDMKYRVKNEDKDYIMHIDNFKIYNKACQIEYDYANNTIKQPNQTVIPFGTIVLIVLLVLIVIIGLIAYVKQRR